MDPSPYEDNYLVHLYFHYVEKYFFFSPAPTFYFLAQTTRVLYFFFFNFLNLLARKGGSPSSHCLPLLFDGRWSMNPGVDWEGTGTFVGRGTDFGWVKDKVISGTEERDDTEARGKTWDRFSRSLFWGLNLHIDMDDIENYVPLSAGGLESQH